MGRKQLAMRILVTGAAGFIGYHVCQRLLNDAHILVGVDNLNDYYDVTLKHARLERLRHREGFDFRPLDIGDRGAMAELFAQTQFDVVINLAAQAGVRYSMENPAAYIDSNVVGFANILEGCRQQSIVNLIYASSSSVYGANTALPFAAAESTEHPLSLYGATKKSNELMAHSYSHLYGLPTTGLRFFTVYGPWGRPDMAMYIFAEKISKGEPITVFNNGDMKRDFTYIDDIISGTRAAIDNNYKCQIFNLGNNKSENLMDMIAILEKELGVKAIIDFKPMQPGDVKESFADINQSIKKLNFKFRDFE